MKPFLKRPRVIVALVLLLLFLIVVLQNAEFVELQLLFWELRVRQLVLLPLIALLGFIVGFLAATMRRRRRRDRV